MSLSEKIDRFLTQKLSPNWRTTLSGVVAAFGFLYQTNPQLFQGKLDSHTLIAAFGLLSTGVWAKDGVRSRPTDQQP
jgi:hypothetical protein